MSIISVFHHSAGIYICRTGHKGKKNHIVEVEDFSCALSLSHSLSVPLNTAKKITSSSLPTIIKGELKVEKKGSTSLQQECRLRGHV